MSERVGEGAIQDARGTRISSWNALETTRGVEQFCKAMRDSGEELAERQGQSAEAFLLSTFEDFDRGGDGMISLEQFRRVLEDINVTKVSEGTLLDVGRYFRAETSRHRGYRREHHGRCNSRYGNKRYGDDSASVSNDDRDIKISYAPLMDGLFDRQKIRSSTTQHKGKSAHNQPTIEGEKKTRNTLLGKMTTAGGERFTDGSDGEKEGLGEDESYVDVRRILEARATALDVPDSLGRRPLFVAAVVGAVSVAETFVRLGATSSFSVEGTGLTAYGVAPSSLMRGILAEARRSLDEKLARKKGYLLDLTARRLKESFSTNRPLEAVKTQGEEAKAGQETKRRRTSGCTGNTEDALCDNKSMRQMIGWISTLADGELASLKATGDILVVDRKTSLSDISVQGFGGETDMYPKVDLLRATTSLVAWLGDHGAALLEWIFPAVVHQLKPFDLVDQYSSKEATTIGYEDWKHYPFLNCLPGYLMYLVSLHIWIHGELDLAVTLVQPPPTKIQPGLPTYCGNPIK